MKEKCILVDVEEISVDLALDLAEVAVSGLSYFFAAAVAAVDLAAAATADVVAEITACGLSYCFAAAADLAAAASYTIRQEYPFVVFLSILLHNKIEGLIYIVTTLKRMGFYGATTTHAIDAV